MQKYEIVHDKVRIRDNASRQWLVWLDGKLRAECIDQQQARDFVAIDREKRKSLMASE